MNQFFVTLLFLVLSISGWAQLSTNFEWSNTQNAGERDTLDITITNDYDSAVVVTVGDPIVQFSDTVFNPLSSDLTIAAGGAEVLRVAVYSRHNLKHEHLLMLATDEYGTFGVQLINDVSYTNHYNGTYNKTGDALKQALKSAASAGQNSLGYNTARNRMYMDIDNQKISQGAAVNTLEGVYTGEIITNYSNRTEAQNMGFNTEHTFPQGFFSSDEPMRSDLFHLFPTNANANSQRGNLPFGVVTNSTWSVGGSKKGGGKFEPRDVHKGQVARAMMYFVIRYQDYSNHFAGQASILRTWHETYPTTALEEDRNDRIDQYQGNRNPFIDYPQFVERFTSFTGNGDLPTTLVSELSDTVLTGEQDQVYAFVFANTGTETINITNLDLTNTTDFSMVVSGDNELLPGEGVEVKVTFGLSNNSTAGFVEIATDENGGENYQVRLAGESSSSNGIAVLQNSTITAYPNPTQGILRTTQALNTVNVYDVTSKVVYTKDVSSTEWDLSNLATGTYWISGNTQKDEKVTIQFVVD